MTNSPATAVDVNTLLASRRVQGWTAALLLSLLAAWVTYGPGAFVVIAVVGAVLLAIGLVRQPWIGTLLLVASVPAQDFGAIHLGGQVLTITRAMFPVAVVGYVLALVVRRERLRGSWIIAPLLALVIIMAASLAWASSTSAAGADVGRWGIALVSIVIALHFLIIAPQWQITTFVVVMALAGVFEATFGVTQSVLALGPESFRVGSSGSRAFGTFGQPNSYAGYLEMVFFPVFWIGVFQASRLPMLLLDYRRTRLRGFDASGDERRRLLLHGTATLLLLGSSAVILGGIVLSYSRGAWLGGATGGVVTLFFFHRWIRRTAPLVMLVGALLILGGTAAVLPSSVGERITTGFDDIRPFDASSVPVTSENFAAAERMAHWQAGWRMFADHPLTGVGAGNFNVRYPDFFVREEFRFSRGHAHNFYIHLLAETGLPGLAAYLVVIGAVTALALVVLVRAPQGFDRMLALGAFGTIVSVGIHNVFENLHVLNLSIQFGLIWALVIVAYRRWERSNHPSYREKRP